MLTLEDVRLAQHRLKGRLHRTPVVHSTTLSDLLGTSVYLKLECLQKTGSFKPRGALNKMLTLTPAEREHGVVTVSGGNHAQGVAYAARELGIAATVAMPKGTPANYVDATRAYGAKIHLTPDIRSAFEFARRLHSEGMVMVHPFDDPLVAAGQGTVGLEILEDVPGITHVYVSIGGGGLITGVATALRAMKEEVHVIGVETEGADAMAKSLAANQIIELPAITSIARTLGAPKVSDFTLEHVKRLVEEVLVVDDKSSVEALVLLLERCKYLTEPAAACCLVAALRQRDRFKSSDQVVLLLCGGNVALADVCGWIGRAAAPAG